MTKPTHKASGKLFEEPERPPARTEGAYTANIDGAARGNPGPAAYGIVIRRPDGATHESLGKYIGRTTNNVAEYYALIAALDSYIELDPDSPAGVRAKELRAEAEKHLGGSGEAAVAKK